MPWSKRRKERRPRDGPWIGWQNIDSRLSSYCMIFLYISLVVLGIWIAKKGCSRRLSAGNPVCTQCHYDLRGTPEPLRVCSECGADLTVPEAVVYGRTRDRPAWIVTGGFLILLGLIGVPLLNQFRETHNWKQHWPTSWLIDDVTGRQSIIRQPGGGFSIPGPLRTERELLTRIDTGNLANDDMQRILTLAAAPAQPQTDPFPPLYRWVRVLMRLHQNGLLTDSELLAFSRQAFNVQRTVTASYKVIPDRGARLYLHLAGPPHTLVLDDFPFGYIWRVTDVSVDGESIEQRTVHGAYEQLFNGFFIGSMTERLPDLPPGSHTVSVTIEYQIIDHANAAAIRQSHDAITQARGTTIGSVGTPPDAPIYLRLRPGEWEQLDLPAPLHQWTETLTATFDVPSGG